MSDADRATDQEFLGMVVDGSTDASVEVTYRLMSPRGAFYGGAGVALACAMMEQTTGRDAVWTTVQFVSGAAHTDRIDLHADVVATGHRTSQVRVRAHTGGREVFTAVGATAAENDKVSRNFASMPSVSAPEECTRAEWPSAADPGRDALRDHRGAGSSGARRRRRWRSAEHGPVGARRGPPGVDAGDARVRRRRRPDGVPPRAGQHQPGGKSLDNSLRVGQRVDTDWVLLALHPEVANHGYAHGTVHLWAPDGTLMGTASQTFVLRSS